MDAKKKLIPLDDVITGINFCKARYSEKGDNQLPPILIEFAVNILHVLQVYIEQLPSINSDPVPHGQWLSAYEYALKIGVTDEDRLEEAKEDKWWKFCNDCEQQVKGFHNYCPNCGRKMNGGNESNVET